MVSVDDGLKHRPKAEWSIVYMNSELTDSEIWLKSALEDETEIETSRLKPVEKTYCLSVAKACKICLKTDKYYYSAIFVYAGFLW